MWVVFFLGKILARILLFFWCRTAITLVILAAAIVVTMIANPVSCPVGLLTTSKTCFFLGIFVLRIQTFALLAVLLRVWAFTTTVTSIPIATAFVVIIVTVSVTFIIWNCALA